MSTKPKSTTKPKAPAKPKAAAKPKTPAKPRKAKESDACWGGPDLFDWAPKPTETDPTVEVHMRVPTGTNITIGNPQNPTTLPVAPVIPAKAIPEIIRELGRLPREQIRETFLQAKLPASDIINFATVIHGILYPLAAVGGKVSGRIRK